MLWWNFPRSSVGGSSPLKWALHGAVSEVCMTAHQCFSSWPVLDLFPWLTVLFACCMPLKAKIPESFRSEDLCRFCTVWPSRFYLKWVKGVVQCCRSAMGLTWLYREFGLFWLRFGKIGKKHKIELNELFALFATPFLLSGMIRSCHVFCLMLFSARDLGFLPLAGCALCIQSPKNRLTWRLTVQPSKCISEKEQKSPKSPWEFFSIILSLPS